MTTTRRLLVTGATGLVGANVARIARAAGWQVRILARPTADPTALEGFNDIARGDVTDAESLVRACDGMDAVVHAAAMVTMATTVGPAMQRVNVQGTRDLLDAARRAGVGRIVHVSTVDAIGFTAPDGRPATPANPADESVPYDNDRYGLPYMRTKHLAEEAAREYAAAGLPVVIVNPTFMFGAWDWKPTSGTMILEVASGKVLAWTGGGNNFVDVEDVASAILAAVDRGVVGERYILGNANWTYREAFTRIAGVIGARPPRFALPRPVALAGGAVAGAAARLLGRDAEINLATARMGYVGHYFDPGKARRELGLAAGDPEVAIERAWRWFRDRGYVQRA
jgi:dihydroflavonol-4-reductase